MSKLNAVLPPAIQFDMIRKACISMHEISLFTVKMQENPPPSVHVLCAFLRLNDTNYIPSNQDLLRVSPDYRVTEQANAGLDKEGRPPAGKGRGSP